MGWELSGGGFEQCLYRKQSRFIYLERWECWSVFRA